MNLYQPKELAALLERHGFHFSKAKGQNFLIREWVPCQIAQQAVRTAGTGVLEIGPGVGALTIQLAPLCEKVVCVELDRSLFPVLEETLAGLTNVTVLQGDILKLNLPELIREQFPGLTPIVCANLPYNITTPVLTALLRSRCFPELTVMVQREVARRICAQAGSREYGSFSLLCQYYADSKILFDVPPDCFLPAPKVTSSVVQMTLHPRPEEVEDETAFFRVVRAAFGQRRKTLVNALSAGLSATHTKEDVRTAILSCGLPEDIRGERLTLFDFAQLARCLFPGPDSLCSERS